MGNAYPMSHWEGVAKHYKEATVHPSELTGGKIESTVKTTKIMKFYPYTPYGTIAVWVKRCHKEGLL
jgi:hypothetical protein